MSGVKPKERAADYVKRLCGLRDNRGKMAALRRGMSPATVMEAWPVIASLGGQIAGVGESPYVDIAALFALHPVISADRDFGETCRRVATADSRGKDGIENFERHFRRLLASGDPSDTAVQLRFWVRMAASKNVGINYEGLFTDLWNWRYYADDVRIKWARSFWAPSITGTIASDESVAES